MTLPTTDEVRTEVRAWLAEHWDPEGDRKDFMDAVVEARWAVPTWPDERWGRAWPAALAKIVRQEFAAAGAPGAGQDETNLWANTALAFGSGELIDEFVPGLLRGKIPFCLLYSEPGAGSDLASVQTRAERDGDEWIVNGQKVWTSGAHLAHYGMLVARTDWDVPKHQGITFFFLPMRQDGVEVRPIVQITGEQHFNEVFMTDARVPDSHRIGDLNDGWRVLQTALAYERGLMAGGDRAPKRAGERQQVSDSIWDPNTDLFDLARRSGRIGDPVVRQSVVRNYTLRTVNRWNNQRAAAALKQGTSSPLLSLGKLAMSRILHEGASTEAMILGPGATLSGDDHPDGDSARFHLLNAFFTSIGGGTDQVQRNILGERVLGLPKEPDPYRGQPFTDVPKPAVR